MSLSYKVLFVVRVSVSEGEDVGEAIAGSRRTLREAAEASTDFALCPLLFTYDP
ncbi:MAG: hypothetical protein V7K47_12965 [Nostoc sp.]